MTDKRSGGINLHIVVQEREENGVLILDIVQR